jgi:hypothetical protein
MSLVPHAVRQAASADIDVTQGRCWPEARPKKGTMRMRKRMLFMDFLYTLVENRAFVWSCKWH